MRKVMNKFLGVLLVLAVVCGAVTLPQTKALAAAKGMETAKVKWDLKNGKKYAGAVNYKCIGTKKMSMGIKNCKKVLVGDKYKITFTYWGKYSNYKLSSWQVDKIIDKARRNPGVYEKYATMYTVLDYVTGKSLECKNNEYGVKVKSGKWIYTYYKKNKAKRYNGGWVRYPKTCTVKVTITYPKEYKDLCIGIGCMPYNIGGNKYFGKNWNKEISFTQSAYYKKGKKYCHFMKVD